LTGAAVRTELLRLAPKYQDIIIDTGGRDTTSQRAALSVADVLLVPFVPRSFDLWTLDKVAELVEEMKTGNPKLRAYTFLNRADPRGTDNDDTARELRDNQSLQFLDTPIGTRKAFSNAAAEGLGVTKSRPADPRPSMKSWLSIDMFLISTNIITISREVSVTHGHRPQAETSPAARRGGHSAPHQQGWKPAACQGGARRGGALARAASQPLGYAGEDRRRRAAP
jgi:hypothetical protein